MSAAHIIVKGDLWREWGSKSGNRYGIFRVRDEEQAVWLPALAVWDTDRDMWNVAVLDGEVRDALPGMLALAVELMEGEE